VLRIFRSEHNKERQRFYLLPGMGGRAYRRKQKFILKTSLAVGLIVALFVAAILYWINRSNR
jgi:hypothetical protein